jgi:hypothetical protein
VATGAPFAGANFLTDGTDDNVQIQAAIDAVVAGGRWDGVGKGRDLQPDGEFEADR